MHAGLYIMCCCKRAPLCCHCDLICLLSGWVCWLVHLLAASVVHLLGSNLLGRQSASALECTGDGSDVLSLVLRDSELER